ncbi:MAG: YggS family pyridoxal phosphate-dependent enzyme [Candidatus Aureabacteria bacterium]|nr:YggS family pyridoxal phosphate-dependent enzyme [Candidatus Auribacterota bacterium]
MSIKENIRRLFSEIPPGVAVVAAAKTRAAEEILEATEAGVALIGENYVQEASTAREKAGTRVQWHLIGHLQTNKAKRAVAIFDLIQTVDSIHLAREIDKRCGSLGKIMPILIEVNSGREPQKSGVAPEGAAALIREISALPHVAVQGLMTMGPFEGDPELARPYFVETKKLFEKLRENPVPNAEMKFLSMGMTNSYRVAIQEGSNMIRVGTLIFGERK